MGFGTSNRLEANDIRKWDFKERQKYKQVYLHLGKIKYIHRHPEIHWNILQDKTIWEYKVTTWRNTHSNDYTKNIFKEIV